MPFRGSARQLYTLQVNRLPRAAKVSEPHWPKRYRKSFRPRAVRGQAFFLPSRAAEKFALDQVISDQHLGSIARVLRGAMSVDVG